MEPVSLVTIFSTAYFLATHAHVFLGKKYPESLFKELFLRYFIILSEVLLHIWCTITIHPLYAIPAILHIIYMIFFEHEAQQNYIRPNKSVYNKTDPWIISVSKVCFVIMDITVFINTLYVLRQTEYFLIAFMLGGTMYVMRWVD